MKSNDSRGRHLRVLTELMPRYASFVRDDTIFPLSLSTLSAASGKAEKAL